MWYLYFYSIDLIVS